MSHLVFPQNVARQLCYRVMGVALHGRTGEEWNLPYRDFLLIKIGKLNLSKPR